MHVKAKGGKVGLKGNINNKQGGEQLKGYEMEFC